VTTEEEATLTALDRLFDQLPPEGHPDRDACEDSIARAMNHALVERHRGFEVRPILRVAVVAGREDDARRWVERVLDQPFPTKDGRVQRDLGRMLLPVHEAGELPPADLFEVRVGWALRRSRTTTRRITAAF
jgi:hypothetical protein